MSAFKRIADPVHGTVSITELESQIIQAKSFQRLRNVKQLGLAYLVYPGADYSRFSHSIGACHLAGQILDVLEAKEELKAFWTPSEIIENRKLLRVAALLHDVGHYPFSHTMEHALEEHYSNQMATGQGSRSSLDHELVGKRLMEHDAEIAKILQDNGVDPKKLSAIFRKEDGADAKLTNLVSADLDVDRLDYLQRTAHHTSLPYGNVDIRYLLSQVCVDKEHQFAISNKALRTAEHLLLGRYFDYLQVSFHKTVAALEWLLSDVISALLECGKIECDSNNVVEMIASGQWHGFDDSYLLEKIKGYADGNDSNLSSSKRKAEALLNRRTPALVAEYEAVLNAKAHKSNFEAFRIEVEKRVDQLASEYDIAKEFWHVWYKKRSLTAVGGDISSDPEMAEKAAKAVRIVGSESKVSTPIICYEPSLMSVLGNYELFILRVYVMLDDKHATIRSDLRKKIGRQVKESFPDVVWKN